MNRAASAASSSRTLAPNRQVAACVVAWVALVAAGCGAFESSTSGVYVEDVPSEGVDSARTHALRMTIFEYGPEIGGFVEFYRIDGVRNTRTAPYLDAPEHCSYFGPKPVRDDQFTVDVDGPHGEPVLLRATWVSRRRGDIAATFAVPGRLADGGEMSPAVGFVEDPEFPVPDRVCPRVQSPDDGSGA